MFLPARADVAGARRDRPLLHKKYGGGFWQKIQKTCAKCLHGTVKVRLIGGYVQNTARATGYPQ